MKPVVIESPYAGNVAENLAYLADCVRDCLRRDEAPFASHGFYTQYLDDTIPEQRALGMEAGETWACLAAKRVVYTDLGISPGMRMGILVAKRLGQYIEYRTLSEWRKGLKNA